MKKSLFSSLILTILIILISGFISCSSDEPSVGGGGSRTDNAYQVIINLSGSLQNPAWSPDGELLVFTQFVNGYNEEPANICTVNLETGEVRTLFSDGSWIAGLLYFSSTRLFKYFLINFFTAPFPFTGIDFL